jgi:hypothetical protein
MPLQRVKCLEVSTGRVYISHDVVVKRGYFFHLKIFIKLREHFLPINYFAFTVSLNFDEGGDLCNNFIANTSAENFSKYMYATIDQIPNRNFRVERDGSLKKISLRE